MVLTKKHSKITSRIFEKLSVMMKSQQIKQAYLKDEEMIYHLARKIKPSQTFIKINNNLRLSISLSFITTDQRQLFEISVGTKQMHDFLLYQLNFEPLFVVKTFLKLFYFTYDLIKHYSTCRNSPNCNSSSSRNN